MRQASAVAIVFAMLAACSPGDEPAGDVNGPTKVAPVPKTPVDPSTQPTVVLRPADGKELRVHVELARSQKQIRQGLMYREFLSADAGMLFLFTDEIVRTFWMKNTLIPLDMIFIGSDMEVKGVVENTEPRSLQSRSIGVPTQFVLEVNGGWAAKNNVGAGTKVSYKNIDAVPPPPTKPAD